MSEAKATALTWVERTQGDWSAWNRTIWDFGETAWREYRSVAWWPCVDPMISVAAKTLAMTALDLLTNPEGLQRAKAEFEERTGGGIGGSKWIAPLCDYEPPLGFRWPEYVTTARGFDWVIPSNVGG